MPAYTRTLPLAILYIVVPELTKTLYTYLPPGIPVVSVAPKDILNSPAAIIPGRFSCYLQDPDGNWLEFVEDLNM